MQSDKPDKLIMMANQIAHFFAIQGEERAVPQIANHIEKFWDPRMRKRILEHVAAGGAGLEPLTSAAIARLKPMASPDAAPGATQPHRGTQAS